MNLLIVCPGYDRFVKVCGDNLARSFSSVTVLVPKWKPYRIGGKCFSPFRTVAGPFSSAMDNVRVLEIDDITPILPWSARQLRKSMARSGIEVDTVLSHFLLPYGYLGNKIAHYQQATSTVVGHGFDVYDLPFKSRMIRLLTRQVIKNADHVVTVSQRNRERLETLGCAKSIDVIPMGYNDQLFQPADMLASRRAIQVPSDVRMILNVGNLVAVKNQVVFVLAIKNLLTRRGDVRAFVVGEGAARSQLQQRIDEEGLADRVTLVGQIPHEQVCVWMNASDCVVLSSTDEGNPTVMFEALACGKPFVGTAVGGIPEVITSDDYGLLCDDSRDFRLLSARIEEALDRTWQAEKITSYASQFSSRMLSDRLARILSDSERLPG